MLTAISFVFAAKVALAVNIQFIANVALTHFYWEKLGYVNNIIGVCITFLSLSNKFKHSYLLSYADMFDARV